MERTTFKTAMTDKELCKRGLDREDDQYEEWFAKFEDEITIELAETGADREMDFDIEREFEKRYEMHLNVR